MKGRWWAGEVRYRDKREDEDIESQTFKLPGGGLGSWDDLRRRFPSSRDLWAYIKANAQAEADAERALEDPAISYAGPIASAKFAGREHDPLNDDSNSKGIGGVHRSHGPARRAQGRADAIAWVNHDWVAIKALAAALIDAKATSGDHKHKDRRLTGRDVRRIVRPFLGSHPEVWTEVPR